MDMTNKTENFGEICAVFLFDSVLNSSHSRFYCAENFLDNVPELLENYKLHLIVSRLKVFGSRKAVGGCNAAKET